MKFLARKPDGPAYELTREEIQDANVIRRLRIDETWQVRTGGVWISMADFLGMTAEGVREVVKLASRHATDSALEPGAAWTPASVICLIFRLCGFYFLYLFVVGLIAGFSMLMFATELLRHLPNSVVASALLLHLCYLAAGIYLARGGRPLLRWAFKDQSSE